MNVRPFEFEAPAEDDPPEMRAAPADGKDHEDDQRDEEPPDEPGYGHGV